MSLPFSPLRLGNPAALFGGFSPLSLSPMIWLDATRMGLSNGASVSSFTDYSGNSRHFIQGTGGNQPVFRTSGINSQAAIEGDGVDDNMTLAAFGAQATWWGFIVFRPVVMASAKELWSVVEYPVTATEYKLLETNSSTTINMNWNPGPMASSLAISANTNYCFLLKGDLTLLTIKTGANITISKTGLTGTSPSTGSRANYGMRLFGRGDSSCYFNVRIGELLFGSGSLSAGDEASVWTYLNAKWGTGVP